METTRRKAGKDVFKLDVAPVSAAYYRLTNHMTDGLFLSGANRAGVAQTQSQSLNLSAIWKVVSAEVLGTGTFGLPSMPNVNSCVSGHPRRECICSSSHTTW